MDAQGKSFSNVDEIISLLCFSGVLKALLHESPVKIIQAPGWAWNDPDEYNNQ